MSDYNDLCRFMRSKLPTAIQKITYECKNQGKYILVGSVPIALTEPSPTLYNKDNRSSMHWDTEQEAIAALLKLGYTKFQLSDCSWYGEV